MTEKLYLSDPYLSQFEATVVEVRAHEGQVGLLLDRTGFYPEGGGQPADHGTLGGVPVTGVVEADGVLLHLVGAEGAPAAGARISGRIDWPRRFDHMQQHHGQHLLSAAFQRLRGAATLSFHLGAETCTIDLDAPPPSLPREALAAVEAETNRLVWADLPIDARERSPAELAALPLRKDAVKGARIVVVGASRDGSGEVIDASPCGGTHPRRTGEVGAVAVLRTQKWGPGTRVEFACGGRVLGLLHRDGERLAQASAALRCAPPELVVAVEKLAEEGQARRKEIDRLVEALAASEAERIDAGVDAGTPVALRLEGVMATPAGVKAVAQALAARGRVALLGCLEGERAHLCFARARGPGVHLGEILREAAALLGGKGGGAPDLAQGSGPARERLDEALAAAAARARGG